MAQQTIDIGGSANDGTGDPIRDAFDKCNDNFTELYAGLVGLLDFKGSTDCSANPNYPAASKGDFYVVSVAGKIGGASGVTVEVGDAYFAKADNAGGTQASVGSSWTVIQANIVGGTISELDDIPDVNAPSPSDGDALVWDSGSSMWVPAPLPGGGVGGTVPDGGTDGQVLTKQSGVDQDADWEDLPGRTLLAEFSADSSTTTFSFTSITNSFSGLEIDCNFTVATNSLIIRANNDSSGVAGTSGKYQMQRTGHSNGAINLQQVLQTGWNVSTSLATGVAVDFRMRLLNYALSAKKLAKYDATWGTSGSGNLAIVIAALLWDNTTAISQLDFIFGAAPTGGKIRLFGLR